MELHPRALGMCCPPNENGDPSSALLGMQSAALSSSCIVLRPCQLMVTQRYRVAYLISAIISDTARELN